MTIVITRNETKTFESMKSALNWVRGTIRNERRYYRTAHDLTDNVNELPPAEKTGIELVDMASYKLSNMGAEQLEELLVQYGYPIRIRKVAYQVAWSENSGLLHTDGIYNSFQEAQSIADKINERNIEDKKFDEPLRTVAKIYIKP